MTSYWMVLISVAKYMTFSTRYAENLKEKAD